jgi:hypothetical protein
MSAAENHGVKSISDPKPPLLPESLPTCTRIAPVADPELPDMHHTTGTLPTG